MSAAELFAKIDLIERAIQGLIAERDMWQREAWRLDAELTRVRRERYEAEKRECELRRRLGE